MPTLELSMIVKNGSRGLARCLKSVQPIVDRITIGDTGSTDNSPAIARAHRATVLPLPWKTTSPQPATPSSPTPPATGSSSSMRTKCWTSPAPTRFSN
jgi:glycosyltransferase involved in cell wall biosynthesis